MRVSALTFACHSKACAPPPTGRGGSLPDTRSRKFDKLIRSTSGPIRQAAEAALAQSIYSGKTPLFHGSSADNIKVGDIIRPSDSPGALALGLKTGSFATRNLDTARTFGRLGGKVYRVEPVKEDLRFLASDELGVHVASPSGFRVVGVEPGKTKLTGVQTAKERKERRERVKSLQDKRLSRKAQIRMETDPAFADVIRRLESIL